MQTYIVLYRASISVRDTFSSGGQSHRCPKNISTAPEKNC